MDAKPIGYTDSGEPVWDAEGCKEDLSEVNDILSSVYAILSESADGGAYGTVQARTLKANIYLALSMADNEATDPCLNCDHPALSHDEAFPSPCMVTNCKCSIYDGDPPMVRKCDPDCTAPGSHYRYSPNMEDICENCKHPYIEHYGRSKCRVCDGGLVCGGFVSHATPSHTD